NLAWTDNSNNETTYEVYRKVGSGSYSLLVSLAANTSSYTDTNVTGATTYTYRVRATNVFASLYTNEASATTVQTPPAAPTNLTASAGASGQVNLAWTNHPSNEIGYEIYRKPAGGS